jgi:hypothetical protein
MELDTDESSAPEVASLTYSDEELDLLAIGFTAVKIAYLQGRFSLLPGLYRVIEKARRASKVPIHETSIRNEHAYYQCIAQSLARRRVTMGPTLATETAAPSSSAGPVKGGKHAATTVLRCDSLQSIEGLGLGFDAESTVPTPAALCGMNPVSPSVLLEAAKNPIYICGDSHVIAPAWSVVYVEGRARLLVPKLVTGVKLWHLRPESDFYPKANFFNALRTIPDGAEVSD